MSRPDEAGGADLASFGEASIASDPVEQFVAWFREAALVPGLVPGEGLAVTLATSTPGGFPSARVVLLKQVDRRGFVFFTNTLSRKGRELRRNPRAAMVAHWPELGPGGRSIRIEGAVEAVTAEESDAYFASRSKGSRIGAWASEQSTVLAGGRAELASRFDSAKAMFGEADAAASVASEVPRPAHWGGVRVVPTAVEFWAAGSDRLHDRLRYERQADASEMLAGSADAVKAADVASSIWRVVRLSP
jgi:pyridoxamine 5'-phosphate oxidase